MTQITKVRSVRQSRLDAISKGTMYVPCLYIPDGIDFEIRLNCSSGISQRLTHCRAESMDIVLIEPMTLGGNKFRVWLFKSEVEIYLKPVCKCEN